MEYEVTQDSDEWRVEAIDYEADGQVYVTIFSGPKAQVRAEEYAWFKRLDEEPSMLMGAEPPR